MTVKPETARQLIQQVKRYGRRKVSAEAKVGIVMEGLPGEQAVAELCRREGISKAVYYQWLKAFLEAGKKRLLGDHAREATSSEVKEMYVFKQMRQFRWLRSRLPLTVQVEPGAYCMFT